MHDSIRISACYPCLLRKSRSAEYVRIELYLEGLEVGFRSVLVVSDRLHHESHVAEGAGVYTVSPSEMVVDLIDQSVGHLKSVLLTETRHATRRITYARDPDNFQEMYGPTRTSNVIPGGRGDTYSGSDTIAIISYLHALIHLLDYGNVG